MPQLVLINKVLSAKSWLLLCQNPLRGLCGVSHNSGVEALQDTLPAMHVTSLGVLRWHCLTAAVHLTTAAAVHLLCCLSLPMLLLLLCAADSHALPRVSGTNTPPPPSLQACCACVISWQCAQA